MGVMLVLNAADVPHRSAQQVTERLDRLIFNIRDIQRMYMSGEKPVDVVLVWPIIRHFSSHQVDLCV